MFTILLEVGLLEMKSFLKIIDHAHCPNISVIVFDRL